MLKGTQTYRKLHVVDATICTLSNKTIITYVRFFYEFKLSLRDVGVGMA
jgi:hypothetical protein